MKKRIQLILRDILFIALFSIFIGIIIRRISRFITMHKESIVHQLDNVLLDYIETTRNHCLKAITEFKHVLNIQEKIKLESMLKNLKTLETQYKKNSHALVLLGPIGTISIVLKEEKIKKNLLSIIIDLNNILIGRSNQSIPIKQIKTIEDGIINNTQLLF